MDLVVTLLLGGVIGWAACLLRGTGQGMGRLANVLAGVVGAVLGRGLAGRAGLEVDLVPARWLAALLGAVLLTGIAQVVRRDRRAPP